MGANLYKTTGTYTPDSLIADNAIPVTAKGIKIAKGEGGLARGALLGRTEDGTYRLTGKSYTVTKEDKTETTATVGADCILTDSVDAADEEVITSAYVTGTFNRAAITLAEGADIDGYETELRKLGIFLKSVQE